jgi:hypothetical protein
MKSWITGRSLDIELTGGKERVEAQLADRGLAGNYIESLAAAALKYAEEETARLNRELVPRPTWPGIVVCRRHAQPVGSAWLLLKHQKHGWHLDSALFG